MGRKKKPKIDLRKLGQERRERLAVMTLQERQKYYHDQIKGKVRVEYPKDRFSRYMSLAKAQAMVEEGLARMAAPRVFIYNL